MQERRNHPRINLDSPVRYRVLSAGESRHSGQPGKQAQLVNISCNGACVAVPELIEATDVVEMHLSLPSEQQNIKVYAEMVWSEPARRGGQHVGLHFLAIRDADAELIAKFQMNAVLAGPLQTGRG